MGDRFGLVAEAAARYYSMGLLDPQFSGHFTGQEVEIRAEGA